MDKANNWSELLKENNCWTCQKNFTRKDVQENNYQIVYGFIYGINEIHNLSHQQCREWYPDGIDCNYCQKPVANLIIVDDVDRTYHPECLKKGGIYYKKHSHPKLLKLEIKGERITAFLEDKREISLPVSELSKRWRKPDLTAEKLKKYEIYGDGFDICFPDADIDTSVLIFIGSYCGCC